MALTLRLETFLATGAHAPHAAHRHGHLLPALPGRRGVDAIFSTVPVASGLQWLGDRDHLRIAAGAALGQRTRVGLCGRSLARAPPAAGECRIERGAVLHPAVVCSQLCADGAGDRDDRGTACAAHPDDRLNGHGPSGRPRRRLRAPAVVGVRRVCSRRARECTHRTTCCRGWCRRRAALAARHCTAWSHLASAAASGWRLPVWSSTASARRGCSVAKPGSRCLACCRRYACAGSCPTDALTRHLSAVAGVAGIL